MATSPSPELMTAEELYTMPDDGRFYELVQERLITVPPSSWLSSVVAAKLMVLVGGFVHARNLGMCGGEQGGIKLAANPDTVRAPDFSFVRRERLPVGGVRPGYFEGAPDLVAEVLSPLDFGEPSVPPVRWGALRFPTPGPLLTGAAAPETPTYADVARKVQEYLDAGVLLVWVIDPGARSAVVYRPGRPLQIVGNDGALDGEEILPGLSLPLAHLWEGLAPEE